MNSSSEIKWLIANFIRSIFHDMRKSTYINIFLLIILTNVLNAQQWDTLAPIPEELTFPVAAVIDGKIYLMGGGGTGGATDHNWMYDPATDTWESRAPIPYRAQQPAGAAVNGKIHYFGGGFPNSGTPLDDHYVYDPVADDWAEAKQLTSPRAIHYGVGLDTLLYSLAGQGKANVFQVYSPEADIWVTRANLPDNGFWYGAHVGTNGKIYRFGGGGYTAPNKLAHVYDPAGNNWSPIKNLPYATHAIKGAAIGNKIFLAGGYHDFLERDEVYVYDIETDIYTTTTPMPLGRNYHSMVAIDSCLYVLGGNHAIDQTVKTQLIRLCPFENITETEEVQVASLDVRSTEGKILIHLPEHADKLSVVTVDGQLLLSEKITGIDYIELNAAGFAKGMVVVKVSAGLVQYIGKVFVN